MASKEECIIIEKAEKRNDTSEDSLLRDTIEANNEEVIGKAKQGESIDQESVTRGEIIELNRKVEEQHHHCMVDCQICCKEYTEQETS